MEAETFAARLKRIREENKYTQVQLAEITIISVQTIRNYEQERSVPVSEYLLELAKALDVTPEYLLKGDNDMNSYTQAIKTELAQLNSFSQIEEIYSEDLNSTILAHLEMSDALISSLKHIWEGKKLFMNKDKESYCTRPYVSGVVLRYCQNRKKYKEKFGIKDGMLLNIKQD